MDQVVLKQVIIERENSFCAEISTKVVFNTPSDQEAIQTFLTVLESPLAIVAEILVFEELLVGEDFFIFGQFQIVL